MQTCNQSNLNIFNGARKIPILNTRLIVREKQPEEDSRTSVETIVNAEEPPEKKLKTPQDLGGSLKVRELKRPLATEDSKYHKISRQTSYKGKKIDLFTENERAKPSNALKCYYYVDPTHRKLVYLCATFPLCENIARGKNGRCDRHQL